MKRNETCEKKKMFWLRIYTMTFSTARLVGTVLKTVGLTRDRFHDFFHRRPPTPVAVCLQTFSWYVSVGSYNGRPTLLLIYRTIQTGAGTDLLPERSPTGSPGFIENPNAAKVSPDRGRGGGNEITTVKFYRFRRYAARSYLCACRRVHGQCDLFSRRNRPTTSRRACRPALTSFNWFSGLYRCD